MKLSTKIILAVIATVIATSLGGALTVYWLSKTNRVNALHTQMSVVLQQANTVANNMDAMHEAKSFDIAGLIDTAKASSGSRPLRETYRSTAFYNIIPIVASWKAAAKSAKDQGYEFYTPSRPDLPARNTKNDSGTEFADAFKAFAAGQEEYFFQDRQTNEIILARPVKLTASCLSCHGDPALSPSHDGKDILGFPMENMKLGDIKGAFVLKAPLTNDAVVTRTMKSMSLISFLLLAAAVTGFYFFNLRFINRPLDLAIAQIDASSEQTAAAANEISASSQTLAEGASEQAASLEETSSSLEELSSMTKRNADSAANAKALSGETRTAADTGATDMGEMRQAMDAIKTSSNDIAKIIKTIDEIAFQTNILALNAAVEAARAGEAGLGFAVVADEVRSLAQRSAQSAKETASKIEVAIRNGEHGAAISEKVAQSLNVIVEKARKVDELVAEIATASNEQSQGIGQINTAVSQMDKVTQANAAGAEETSAAAEELHAQSETMKDAVNQLRLFVDGDQAVSQAVNPSRPDRKHQAASALSPKSRSSVVSISRPRDLRPPVSARSSAAEDFKDM